VKFQIFHSADLVITGWLTGVRFPAGPRNFSACHRFQTSSGVYPAIYRVGRRGSFRGGKAAGAWSWPSPPSSAEVKNAVHCPTSFHWRSAYLSTGWALPYLTLPYRTLSYLILPYLILPYLTLPYLILSYRTLSYLTLSYITLPYLTDFMSIGNASLNEATVNKPRDFPAYNL